MWPLRPYFVLSPGGQSVLAPHWFAARFPSFRGSAQRAFRRPGSADLGASRREPVHPRPAELPRDTRPRNR
jgi:hypothetical protein